MYHTAAVLFFLKLEYTQVPLQRGPIYLDITYALR